MRQVDPISQTLALWLLYLALAVAGISQLPKLVASIRERVQQPTVTTTRQVSL